MSFTVSDDEVSLLLDATSLSHVAEKNLEIVLEEEWVPIKRCQKAGASSTIMFDDFSTSYRLHRNRCCECFGFTFR